MRTNSTHNYNKALNISLKINKMTFFEYKALF